MAAWIECVDCGIEFRNKPGRKRCPECGARIEVDEDRDDRDERDEDEEPRPRKKKKSKKMSPAMLYSLIGVGVLAVALVVVLVLLLVGGKRGDPAKVTVPNFQKITPGMPRSEAENILGGSSSSSLDDMQRELTKTLGPAQAIVDGTFAQMLTGAGTWRRWDGPNLKVWAIYSSSGSGGDRVGFTLAVETLPDGRFVRHQGVQTFGGLGGFPFQPQQIPPFPFQK